MPKKAYSPEQIINELREVEVLFDQGATVDEVSRKLGVIEKRILAKTEKHIYGELLYQVGPNGSICHRVRLILAAKSTKLYASHPKPQISNGPGIEAGCSHSQLALDNFMTFYFRVPKKHSC